MIIKNFKDIKNGINLLGSQFFQWRKITPNRLSILIRCQLLPFFLKNKIITHAKIYSVGLKSLGVWLRKNTAFLTCLLIHPFIPLTPFKGGYPQKTNNPLKFIIHHSPFKLHHLSFIIFLLFPLLSFSQNCTYNLSGYVKDGDTQEPLIAVNITVEGLTIGAITDENGFFKIENLCDGPYHVVFSHIGCESQRMYWEVHGNKEVTVELHHAENILDGIVVTGKAEQNTTQNAQTLNEQNISDNANENLSNLLANISGVSVLKNGNGIAKPIVHGLYGNRLTILNNGVAQSGQQWGNDHSPEIDPLVANKIKVVKGVSSLAYPGANLGSVVLVEPKKINREPHLHGKGTYFFESNGLGNGLNVQLQQYSEVLAWKINGTLKKSGDKRTSSYFLNNTGNEEANIAIQLEKSFSDKLFTNLYISSFNTELGVLRGSHVGNLTDLESALTRDIPFFTDDTFSYRIEAPMQVVNHHLLKFNSKYYIEQNAWLEFTFAGQLNNRREFDVRRSGRTDIPALSLLQKTYYVEGKYEREANGNKLSTGLQFNMIDNTNNPETGISPLIPDYYAYEGGAFALFTKSLEKWFVEFGGRYDFIAQNVAVFTTSVPRELIQYKNRFHNYSASGGLNYKPTENLSINYNLGYATRSPAINELYSNGLHQGVSGIEEGNPNLLPENSIKTTFSINGQAKERFSFESLFYYQNINNYIFLNPQNETRLTIRGAFPVFKYEQTNAQIFGLDFTGNAQLSKMIGLKMVYSYIKGMDISNDEPLIFMPANNISGTLTYEIPKWKQFENLTLSITNKYVFQQNNILAEQDFVEPPAAYNLINFQLATDMQLQTQRLRLFTSIDNVLNVAYRDYLNRQRYFADDLGRNITVGLSIKF